TITLVSPSKDTVIGESSLTVSVRCTDESGVVSVRMVVGIDTVDAEESSENIFTGTIKNLVANVATDITVIAVDSTNAQITSFATVKVTWVYIAIFSLDISSDHGRVERDPDGTSFDSGTVVNLTPIPESDYHFSGWGGDLSGSDNPATILMNSDKSVTAIFVENPPNTYSLTVVATNGKVTRTPDLPQYESGTDVGLKAVANEGYHFVNWAGDASGTGDSATVTMTAAMNVTANFALNTYKLTVNAGTGGSIDTPKSSPVMVNHGEPTTITAIPDEGYTFNGWTIEHGGGIDDVSEASTSVMLTSGDATVTATFTRITYTLTVTDDGHGTTDPDGDVTINHGAETVITATSESSSHFVVWRIISGTVVFEDSTQASTTVALRSGNAEIEAVFAINRYLLTVNKSGNGTVEPVSDSVTHDIPFSIEATAAIGYHFIEWRVTNGSAVIDNPSGTATAVTLTSGNATVEAVFEPDNYLLTVQSAGNGTVSGSDSVGHGVGHAITATPELGYMFIKWNVVSGTVTIVDKNAASTTVILENGDAVVEGQFRSITFSKSIAGIPNGGTGISVLQTSDSGYVILGTTNFGTQDIILVKTDMYGDSVWTKIIGGTEWEGARSLQQTSDGGYIIAGQTRSSDDGSYDLFLVKTNENGVVSWTKTYGAAGEQFARCVRQTSDGGYIIVSSGLNDSYLVKTNSLGDTVWTRIVPNVSIKSLQQTTDDGYMMVAENRNGEVELTKTDPGGETEWKKTFKGSGMARPYSIQKTSDDGYVIIGNTKIDAMSDDNIYLLKTDESGDAIWTRIFGGSGEDLGYPVQQTSDGGYIIAAGTTSYGAGDWDIYLIKTDATGNITWSKTFGGTKQDIPSSVRQTSDHGYIITGEMSSFSTDIHLIKTDENGDVFQGE
ncbi:MAG: InlB B-repeat-containing protein, partial [Chitinispirillaceae bacterium]|nr:InlB B-repeat-containing protein [Chitinispirillaceae bacterium]